MVDCAIAGLLIAVESGLCLRTAVRLKGYARVSFCFFFQAEDGIRDLVRSRGLGDVYKRQDRIRSLRSCQPSAPGLNIEQQVIGLA